MTKGKPNFPSPGVDERLVAEEMLRDRHSKLWEDCGEFVTRRVYAKAKNISNHQEEIIQEVMYKVTKYLPYFQFKCALKTWLYTIIEHCVIDMHRRPQNQERFNVPSSDPLNESDREDRCFKASKAKSAEDVYMTNDELRNAMVALLEYANAHSNPIRNRLIIRMIIFEGHTHFETAKAAGCNAPVVGFVVREAQRYAREKMGHEL